MLPIIRFIVPPMSGDNLENIYEKSVSIFFKNASIANINKELLNEWLFKWLQVMYKVHVSNPPLPEGTWDEYYVSTQYYTNETKFDIKAMVLFTG